MHGILTQTNKDKIKAKLGEELYTNLLERRGVKDSFERSLNASSKGWKIPIKLTLFGPKRIWKSPITFRSNKVKKATESRISKHWTSQTNKFIKEY